MTTRSKDAVVDCVGTVVRPDRCAHASGERITKQKPRRVDRVDSEVYQGAAPASAGSVNNPTAPSRMNSVPTRLHHSPQLAGGDSIPDRAYLVPESPAVRDHQPALRLLAASIILFASATLTAMGFFDKHVLAGPETGDCLRAVQ